MMNKLSYAGVGSRGVPQEIEEQLTTIAIMLANKGWTLNSGAAKGCDKAFEDGVLLSENPDAMRIYLPWEGFNDNDSLLFNISPEAISMAEKFHPAGKRMKDHTRKYMARNCYQVLSETLDDPVRFVLCYTPDGCEDGKKTTRDTGGTGQAIRVATANNIPIFNFANPNATARFKQHFDMLYSEG